MPANPKNPATVPARIGRFQVRALLGAGAFGSVYRAADPLLGREVALKVAHPGLLDNPSRVERFLREARAAAGLRHPHLVPVFDAGHEGDTYYLAAAFVEGQTLAHARKQGALDTRQVVEVVRQLAEALAYAHRRGIVHRDVKPANVLLDSRNQAYLADFGLAHRQGTAEKLTHDGAVMGTPAYMAPEQAEGRTGEPLPASDQYSLGVVLYELLCGQTPFTGPPVSVLYEVLHKEPPRPRSLNPRLPRDLERVCLKAMAKRPKDRYPGCQELADDLRRWLEGEPVRVRPIGLVERAWRWGKREPAVALASAAAALALLAAVLVPVTMSLLLAAAVSDNETAENELNSQIKSALQAKAQADQSRDSASAAAERARTAAGQLNDEAKNAANAEKEAAKKEADAHQALRKVKEREGNVKRFRYAAEIQRAQYALEAGDQDKLKDFLDKARAASGEKEFRFEERHLQWPNSTLRVFLPPLEGEQQLVRSLGNRILLRASAVKAAPQGQKLLVEVWDLNRRVKVQDKKLDWYDRMLEGVGLLSPDGRSLLADNRPERLRVLRLDPENKLQDAGRYDDPSRTALAVSFAHDGSRIATLHKGVALRVWDVRTGKQGLKMELPAEDLTGLALSPDGSVLATALGMETTLWDVQTKAKRGALREQQAPARTKKPRRPGTVLAFSPDGKLLATSAGGEVKVWDVADGRERATLPESLVSGLLFSPDSRSLLGCCGDDKMQAAVLWDAASGKKRGRFEQVIRGRSAAFSPDSKVLAILHASGDALSLCDAGSGERRMRLPLPRNGATALAFSPDGEELAIAFADGEVQLRPRMLLERITALDQPGTAADSLAFDPRAQLLAIAAGGKAAWWDLGKGRPRGEPAVPKGTTRCAANPLDGRLIAAATAEGVVLLREGGAAVPALEGGQVREVRGLAFSSDGKFLAAGLASGGLRVWDVTTGKRLLAEDGQKPAARSLAIAAGGRLLATADGERVLLWDLSSGKQSPLVIAKVACLAFTPDGKTLIAGEDGAVVLWDLESGKQRARATGHRGLVRAVACSGDGKTIASGGADGTVRLWESLSGGELLTFKENAEAVTGLAFAADGTALAASYGGGAVRLWYARDDR